MSEKIKIYNKFLNILGIECKINEITSDLNISKGIFRVLIRVNRINLYERPPTTEESYEANLYILGQKDPILYETTTDIDKIIHIINLKCRSICKDINEISKLLI